MTKITAQDIYEENERDNKIERKHRTEKKITWTKLKRNVDGEGVKTNGSIKKYNVTQLIFFD